MDKPHFENWKKIHSPKVIAYIESLKTLPPKMEFAIKYASLTTATTKRDNGTRKPAKPSYKKKIARKAWSYFAQFGLPEK